MKALFFLSFLSIILLTACQNSGARNAYGATIPDFENDQVDIGAIRCAEAVERHFVLRPVALLLQEYQRTDQAHQDRQVRNAGQAEVGFDGQEHRQRLTRGENRACYIRIS